MNIFVTDQDFADLIILFKVIFDLSFLKFIILYSEVNLSYILCILSYIFF